MFDWILGLVDPMGTSRGRTTSKNNNKNKTTKLKTKVYVNGKEYDVYKSGGKYFYDTGTSSVLIPDKYVDTIAKNKAWSVDISEKKSTTTNTNTNTNTNTGGSGGGTPSYSSGGYTNNSYVNDLLQRIYELEHPKVYSAQELADIYGIDYNEQNILNDYNKATNEYYDNAVAEQDALRTQYARNNAQYLNQVTNSYLDSYKNAAPTAVGKGSLAANALTTELNAGSTNATNDYGMAQSINTLEKARKAELANNSNLAKQYYNRIGTYLSGLSADLNASDVQQYVDQLNAYSTMYAADRSYQGYLAQAAASKYSGLANAAQSNAYNSANNYNAFESLWNYFNSVNGSSARPNYASNAVGNLLKTNPYQQ